MPTPSQLKYIDYDTAREHIRDADVLLFRGRALISRAIKIGTRSDYSHVGLAGWSNGSEWARLSCYEMVWSGGQGVSLRHYAETIPGQVDVYHVQDMHVEMVWDHIRKELVGTPKTLNRRMAVALMQDFCRPGTYGKWHLVYNMVTRLPVLRIFFRPPNDDQFEDGSRMPVCSEAGSNVLKRSFTDVVRQTSDMHTSPGDLARSPLLHYKFTLDTPKISVEEKELQCALAAQV